MANTQDATPQSPDMAQMGDDESQEKANAIAVIEVTVMSDGSITVENETGQQEAAEMNGGEAAGAKPVSVSDSQEAGELVTHLIAQALSTNGNPDQTNKQNLAQQREGYEGQ